MSVPYRGSIEPLHTSTVTQLRPAPAVTKLREGLVFAIAAVLIWLIARGASLLFDAAWIDYVGIGLSSLTVLFGAFSSLTAKVAECPYCAQVVAPSAEIMGDAGDSLIVECPSCRQWLVKDASSLRAFGADEQATVDKYHAPVFKDAVWPDECIVCGAAVTFRDAPRKTKVQLSRLLVGRLSVASAAVHNVPYCDEHRDAVSLDVKDDNVRVVFTAYPMLQRYLAVNSRIDGKTVRVNATIEQA